jgi:hypothetical protein
LIRASKEILKGFKFPTTIYVDSFKSLTRLILDNSFLVIDGLYCLQLIIIIDNLEVATIVINKE